MVVRGAGERRREGRVGPEGEAILGGRESS